MALVSRKGAFLSLLIGLIACIGAGFCFAIEVYRDIAHRLFNYTFLEGDIIATSGMVGFSIGYPFGLLILKITPMWICVVSCVGSTLSYLLLWSTTSTLAVYIHKPWLICFYNFLAGHSLSYLYHGSVWVSVRNIPQKYWGKVIGLLHAGFGCSPILLLLIYRQYFADSLHVGAVFLVVVGACAGSSFLGIVGLRFRSVREATPTLQPSDSVARLTTAAIEVAPSDAGSSTIDSGDESDDIPSAPPPTLDADQVRNLMTSSVTDSLTSTPLTAIKEFGRILCRCDFQCLLWTFLFAFVSVFNLIHNLHDELRTINGDQFALQCDLCFLLSSVLCRLLAGVVADAMRANRLPLQNLLYIGLLGCLMTGVALTALPTVSIDLWMVHCVMSGALSALLWCSIPLILTDSFRLKLFPFLWSTVLLSTVFACFALQVVYRLIEERKSSQMICIGSSCVRWPLLVQTVLTFCALVLNCIHSRCACSY